MISSFCNRQKEKPSSEYQKDYVDSKKQTKYHRNASSNLNHIPKSYSTFQLLVYISFYIPLSIHLRNSKIIHTQKNKNEEEKEQNLSHLLDPLFLSLSLSFYYTERELEPYEIPLVSKLRHKFSGRTASRGFNETYDMKTADTRQLSSPACVSRVFDSSGRFLRECASWRKRFCIWRTRSQSFRSTINTKVRSARKRRIHLPFPSPFLLLLLFPLLRFLIFFLIPRADAR